MYDASILSTYYLQLTLMFLRTLFQSLLFLSIIFSHFQFSSPPSILQYEYSIP